jgi:hypothetical protein
MRSTILEFLQNKNVDIYDTESVIDVVLQHCKLIAMSYSKSCSFQSYDELDEYDRGCDDTAVSITSRINDLLK